MHERVNIKLDTCTFKDRDVLVHFILIGYIRLTHKYINYIYIRLTLKYIVYQFIGEALIGIFFDDPFLI